MNRSKRAALESHPDLFYVGPDLKEGPLPAIFYFSLSAQDSLDLDPFNQPVAFWSQYPLRVFSLTLPGHEEGMAAADAMVYWAEKIAQGSNIILDFTERVLNAIEALIERNVIIDKKIAVAGLSRGGFTALHAAAASERIHSVLAFAPVTHLLKLTSFQEMENHPIIASLNLELKLDSLAEKEIRCYIGNRDIRVGTADCFEFLSKVTERAFQKQIRSPQIELTVFPSIGRDGHGTPPEIFQQGALWLKDKLLKG
jgi:predicted esterase